MSCVLDIIDPVWLESPIDEESPLSAGLIGAWLTEENLSGGKTFYDLVGLNHGALTNNPTWSNVAPPGGRGSINFAATGYVSVGNLSTLDGSNTWTVAAWVRPPSLPFSGYQGFFSRGTSGNRTPWCFGVNGQSYINCDHYGIGGGAVQTANLTAGVWQHIVFTQTGTALAAYVNGVLSNSAASSATLPTQDKQGVLGFIDGFTPWGDLAADYLVYKRGLQANDAYILFREALADYPTIFKRLSGITTFAPLGATPISITDSIDVSVGDSVSLLAHIPVSDAVDVSLTEAPVSLVKIFVTD